VSAYLALDFVASDSLDVVARVNGPAPVVEAVRVANEIGAALDFAADANILHGALHPRDILVSSDDARLTGLGIARALHRLGVTPSIRRPYTAPERQAGHRWDRRADVFSLAAIVHELIWGRRITALGQDAASSLTPVAGADLDALRTLFARALAESPFDRFDSAAEFASELKHAILSSAARRIVVEEELRLPLEADLVDEPIVPDEPEIVIDRSDAFDAPPVVLVEAAQEEFPGEELDPPEEPAETPGREEPAPMILPPEPERKVVHARAPAAVPAIAREQNETVDRMAPAAAVVPPPAFAALDEPSRSSLWPLALSLAIGLAVGFAAGYASGGRASSRVTIEASSETVPPILQAPAGPPPAVPETEVRMPEPAAAETPAREVPKPPPVPAVRPTPPPRRSTASQTKSSDVARNRAPSRPAPRPAPSPSVSMPSSDATTSAIMVESRPSGASVHVDGRLVGKTPLKLMSVAPGDHAVTLEHDGYQRWTSSVRIVAGKPARVAASLER
jgi:serine/threonine protein kinase